MPIPWLRMLDAALGLANVARSMKRRGAADDLESLARSSPGGTAIEARLAGVVVAALKEAFDRDHVRLELEREQIEAERQRAERALRLELLRQAADREVARLRLLSGVIVAAWLGTLFFSDRLLEGAVSGRVLLGTGWLVLLSALAATFVAQSAVAKDLTRASTSSSQPPDVSSGPAGALGPWLLVAGLAVVALAILVT
jgi:hypothetical protein